jgi:hypothetical protein
MTAWWALIGGKAGMALVANGVFHPVLQFSSPTRILESVKFCHIILSQIVMTYLLQWISELERIYTNAKIGGVIGGNLIRQAVFSK